MARSSQAACESPPRQLPSKTPVRIPRGAQIHDHDQPDAVITSAERARHATWAASTQAAWSPQPTADSLRQVAATSHRCEILLRPLADRTTKDENPPPVRVISFAAGRRAAGR
jgi:hypothetical protein